jgi:hypothetical protein
MDRTIGKAKFHRFQPKLELLDDRIVPSCTWDIAGSVLTITGSNDGDDIAITDDGTLLSVTCDGEAIGDDLSGVTEVIVRSGNGEDTVSYELTGDLSGERVLDIRMGNRDDTFTGDVSGNLLDGSSLTIEARGCNGKDSLAFDVAGDVAADAALAVDLGGGNGKDVLGGSFAGILLGDLTWHVNGGNGKDEMAGDFTFDATSTGTNDVEYLGWNAPDTVALFVTDNSGDDGDDTTEDESTLGDSTFVVDGGRAPDQVDASDIVDVIDSKGKP